MSLEKPNAEAFSGWLNEGAGWVRVCFAVSRALCWDLLLEREAAGHCERLVLPKGQHPNQRRRPR